MIARTIKKFLAGDFPVSSYEHLIESMCFVVPGLYALAEYALGSGDKARKSRALRSEAANIGVCATAYYGVRNLVMPLMPKLGITHSQPKLLGAVFFGWTANVFAQKNLVGRAVMMYRKKRGAQPGAGQHALYPPPNATHPIYPFYPRYYYPPRAQPVPSAPRAVPGGSLRV